MHAHLPRRRRRDPGIRTTLHGSRERGAAIVEMAVVLPLLILLVFGMVEFGLLFREKMTIASATTSAARTGATMGNREEADIRILQALEAGLYGQVDASVIVSVDIFRAVTATGTKTSDVNTYVFSPLVTCRWSPCPDPLDTTYDVLDFTWSPLDRDTTLDPLGGGLDVLGIEILYHHSAATGLIPGVERDLSERTLVRLEPNVFGASP
jgi:Flp pilus assembly protein TadG